MDTMFLLGIAAAIGFVSTLINFSVGIIVMLVLVCIALLYELQAAVNKRNARK